jgi:hypothetical protein
MSDRRVVSAALPVRPSAYTGATFSLLTQHGKERVLAPIFLEAWAARVERVDGYDTDTLGTFTREVPRFGSQLDAARKKATVGMELSGSRLGLASEGAFSPGPFGVGCVDREIVVLVDAARGIEIVGRSEAPTVQRQAIVRTTSALVEIARRAGFPEHALVVRPNGPYDLRLHKGVHTWKDLRRAFHTARAQSSDGEVFVENDCRAHVHPTRREIIAAATRDLLQRASSFCPSCEAPGFGRLRRLPGLPCADCGAPTHEARGDELACVACSYRELVPSDGPARADAFFCEVCNP